MTDVTAATMWLDGAIRLLVAVGLGGAIGINRELADKPAGLRTHALVALGAALVMVVSDALVQSDEPGAVTRSIQGLITGIGFLGAGVILHPSGESSVRGLTTAATIWIAAALGIACGAGLWPLAAMATAIAMVVLIVGQMVDRWVGRLARRFSSASRGQPPH
jgi:putative Mg2+ transporter-C (MgtC) family protein